MSRKRKFQVIYNPEKIDRTINFEGVTYPYTSSRGNSGYLMPSDLDAFMDLRGKAWVLIEVKEDGADWPRGQLIAFRRLATDLMKARPTLAIRAVHPKDATEIDLASCIVHSYLDKPGFYRGGHWQELDDPPLTVKKMIDLYVHDLWNLSI